MTDRPLSRFLERDHREIEALLAASCARDGFDLAIYQHFRAKLLRHIGCEEKILFPAAAKARGEPLRLAPDLRRDHGRIAALLTRKPTSSSLSELSSILTKHDALEEGPGGVYDECETLLADVADELIARMRAAPEVPLAPFYEGPIPLPKR